MEFQYVAGIQHQIPEPLLVILTFNWVQSSDCKLEGPPESHQKVIWVIGEYSIIATSLAKKSLMSKILEITFYKGHFNFSTQQNWSFSCSIICMWLLLEFVFVSGCCIVFVFCYVIASLLLPFNRVLFQSKVYKCEGYLQHPIPRIVLFARRYMHHRWSARMVN